MHIIITLRDSWKLSCIVITCCLGSIALLAPRQALFAINICVQIELILILQLFKFTLKKLVRPWRTLKLQLILIIEDFNMSFLMLIISQQHCWG